jgi:N6-adenosine-specific RNA methylase IME4
MFIKEKIIGGKKYYALYNGRKFVRHIGNNEAYQKYLKDVEKKERELASLNGINKIPTPNMPQGKYDVIYADPPWRYDFDVDSRATENHYPTLTKSAICKLKDKNKIHIQDKFDDNAILYLWTTAPKLNECFDVLIAWGFKYKTNIIWVKDKIGLGWYCRNQHEILIIAEKGEMPLPEANVRPPSILNFPRTTHSTKPPELYKLIETWYPSRRYLEIFGVKNNSRPNYWGVFGNGIYE